MKKHRTSPAVAAAPAASFEADLNPLPAPDTALVPHAEAAPPAAPDDHASDDNALDDHGFDPAEYKWVPVLRKPRKDGWTPQRQVEFIAALADTGCVEQAARLVDMTVMSCYRLRRAPGAENFARAWDAAIANAARRLVDLAFDRAIHGSNEPVFDRDGRRVGRRMRQNDRLLMFLLRAYMPDRFRHAHRDMASQQETPPPLVQPLGDALERLEPALPPEPYRLMPPDELETELLCADIADGELPHWYRGKGDAEPPAQDSLGPEFEAALEEAKRAAWDPSTEDESEAD